MTGFLASTWSVGRWKRTPKWPEVFSDPEVPVMREAQKLGVLSDATSGRSLILSDDSLHLVEQQFMRHTTKEAERRLEAPDLAHVLLHLRVAADVSARLDLLKEPHGGQRRVLGQSAQDDALVRIHLGRHRRPGPVLHSLIAHVPVQLLGLDPVVNCSTTHAQQLRHSRLRHALLKIMPQQHSLLPSDHRASTSVGETPRCTIGYEVAQGSRFTPRASQPRSRRVCNFGPPLTPVGRSPNASTLAAVKAWPYRGFRNLPGEIRCSSEIL